MTCETETLPAICSEGIPCKASTSDSETTIMTEATDSVEERNQSEDLEGKLLQAQQELMRLCEENDKLMGKLDEKEKQLEILSASYIFSLDRLKSDADINFYTGLSNFASFTSIFELLDPGEDGTNI